MSDNTPHDPEKIDFWRAKIAEQQASGIPQSDFCRQNKLSPHKFGYWKGILFPELRQPAPKKTIKTKRAKVESPYECSRLVKKWEKSGLTQAEFCRKERIFEWQFSDWKRRVAKERKIAAATKKPQPQFVEVSSMQRTETNAKSAKPVSAKTPGTTTLPKVIAEFKFNGGLISILADTSLLDLKNIIKALMECTRDNWTF